MFNLVLGEKTTATRHMLVSGESTVGRSVACEIAIDDPSVSRRQARITVAGQRCHLVDLDSTNGTFVNGEAITEADLADGDAVVFGEVPGRIEWSVEDKLALTDDRELIESSATMFRPVGPKGAPLPTGRIAVDGKRLLGMLSEISRTLVKPQQLLDVLGRVVDLAFSSVPAERAFLMLVDDATGSVVPRVARKRDGSPIAQATVSRTVVKRVMNEHVAILAKDAQSDTRLAGAQSIVTGSVRSFMCAPLWGENDVIGVFYVDNPHTLEFAPDDLELFTALSDYAAVAIEQARLSARVLEETRRRERLQRYHSPAVVDRILADAGDGSPQMTAQEREISVVFCDVVGFTTMSERMGPTDVARMLNRIFSRMADVIFEHEGTLDKFIGDAVMAVFGAPIEQPDHALRAVRAALDMRQALADLNAQQPDRPVEVRIAINSGLATAGDIGSPKRREYTVLGDVVNTCSRMESMVCKPGQIVATRETCERLDGSVKTRSIGAFKLRGREAEVEAFEIVG